MAIIANTRFGVAEYLQREFLGVRCAAKLIARLANCSHRTCEAWLQGRSHPRAEHLAAMLRSRWFRHRFLTALDAICGEADSAQLLGCAAEMRAEIGRIEAMLRQERGAHAEDS